MTGQGPVGRVEQIRVYPVRSLAGRVLTRVDVGPGGLAGDRVWTVTGDDGPVRSKDAPVLASLAPDVDAETLSVALGRPVRLEPSRPQPGAAPVHLVSQTAVDRAAAGETPEGCSAQDPRANLVLALDGDERAWTDRNLRIGTTVLRLTRTPTHCLGIYADVLVPGVVATGDPVELV